MIDEPRFDLYSFWRTSATYRIRVALNLKGIVAREHDIDIDAGEHRGDTFLRINPMGAIPVLIDHAGDPTPLTQSLAILEFLEEVAPQVPILPQNAHDRVRVRSLASILVADTHPFIVPRVKKYLAEKANFDADAFKAWQTHWVSTGLKAYETNLAGNARTGRFSHGDTPTIADICLASIVVVTRVFGLKVEGVPTVDRIIAECEAMDAFAKADPRRQAGAPKAA